MPRLETYLAELFADEVPVPGYIYLGSGAFQEYALSNRDDFEVLGDAFELIGQGFIATSFISIQTVLVPMKRIGAGAATLWMTIEGVTGSDPDNTPITNGTSQIVLGSVIPTADFDWVAFTFSPAWQSSGAKFMVIHHDDYTYSAAVSELQVGFDASSAVFGGGTLRVDDVGDGSSWGPHPVGASDLVFRQVRVMDPDFEDIPSSLIVGQPIVSLGSINNETRLLALFGTSVANDWIREMYLMEDADPSDPLAIAQVNVKKTNQQVLQAYWLIRFTRDPEDV